MVFFCLCVLLVLSLFVTKPLYRRSLFNPLVVFYSVWTVSFFLYELDATIQLFYVRLSPIAELLFILSFIGFFVGAVSYSFSQSGNQSPSRAGNRDSMPTALMFKFTKVALVLFLFGVAYKYFLLIRQFGNPFAVLDVIRQASVSGGVEFPFILEAMTTFSYFVIANLGILLIYHPRKRLIAALIVVTIFSAYLKDTTVAGRGSTFINGLILICSVFAAAMAKGVKLRLKHYLAGAGVGLGVVLSITTILFLRGGNSVTFLESFFKHNYLYVVGPIPAFSEFLNQPWPASMPAFFTLGGLHKLADMAVRILTGNSLITADDNLTRYARVTKEGPFNTSGHLTYYHSDFGEIGIVVVSFILGVLGSYFFYKAIKRSRPLDIQLFALMMVYLIFSIRGVLTGGPSFWITVILIVTQQALLTFNWQVFRRRGDKASIEVKPT